MSDKTARLRALVEQWRRQADVYPNSNDGLVARAITMLCADDLAALLDAPTCGSKVSAEYPNKADRASSSDAMVRASFDPPRDAPAPATCLTHGDPLVCLSCEAEEDERPEWAKAPATISDDELRAFVEDYWREEAARWCAERPEDWLVTFAKTLLEVIPRVPPVAPVDFETGTVTVQMTEPPAGAGTGDCDHNVLRYDMATNAARCPCGHTVVIDADAAFGIVRYAAGRGREEQP
ncbi:MAG: hypothetical protein NUW01_18645 [Gemmatimonadaceae bacterium]|nr:hypothetical protein [Gemmatimonadaceae bacterium]